MLPLSTSVSSVTQMWKSIRHLTNPEDGGSTFSETSVRASVTRYQVHEDIFNWYRRESSLEISCLQTIIEVVPCSGTLEISLCASYTAQSLVFLSVTKKKRWNVVTLLDAMIKEKGSRKIVKCKVRLTSVRSSHECTHYLLRNFK
jgi:hypothetical protein